MAIHQGIILHLMTGFATTCMIGHSRIHSPRISEYQKAIEKHNGFGHIVVPDVLGLPRIAYSPNVCFLTP